MASHSLKERGGITGRILFSNLLIENPTARAIDEYLSTARDIPQETFRRLMAELRSLCPVVRELAVSNQVILAARSELAKRLCGTQAYTGIVNYGALGSGSTAVSDADTVLDTEVARALVGSATETDDVATIDFYYSKSATSGTYEEFGTFIDGTGSADSGLLFNRALTGGWTKTSLEGMTVSVELTFNAA